MLELRVADPAVVPSSPIAPRPVRSAALATVLALFVFTVAALTVESLRGARFDHRVKAP